MLSQYLSAFNGRSQKNNRGLYLNILRPNIITQPTQHIDQHPVCTHARSYPSHLHTLILSSARKIIFIQRERIPPATFDDIMAIVTWSTPISETDCAVLVMDRHKRVLYYTSPLRHCFSVHVPIRGLVCHGFSLAVGKCILNVFRKQCNQQYREIEEIQESGEEEPQGSCTGKPP